MSEKIEFQDGVPDGLTVTVINGPAYPISTLWAMAQPLGRAFTPEGIEDLFACVGTEEVNRIPAWHSDYENWAGVARHMECESPEALAKRVCSEARELLRSGSKTLNHVALTLKVEHCPIWLGMRVGIQPYWGQIKGEFYDSGAWHLPPGLANASLKGFLSGVTTAERAYADAMKVLQTTMQLLLESGVAAEKVYNLVPLGATFESLWSLSLGEIRDKTWPDEFKEPLRAALRAFHPAYPLLIP